ncbi:glycosyltransferase [Pseudomonas fluorescens]|uniref:Glycosyltransferase 2-like domain-containing protein n=1 Tax=Pseudomonas fluorescens TaxID=294 RepID=A0A5E7VT52_PSEFL|nr:glycosyltransferase [Pseudomonas fluorescens]VVQ26031.1 hypothetical protein PS928_06322 [Pseudomonas fluorescens]
MTNVKSSSRFRASVILLAYNQTHTIQVAAKALLAQEGEPLEIILSDDKSSDDTYKKPLAVANNYQGIHHVSVRQSEQNKGLMAHLKEAVKSSSCELIILAAGDDVSIPQRAKVLINAWCNAGEPHAVLYSDFTPINAAGKIISDFPEKVFSGKHTSKGLASGKSHVLGATTAITRSLFERFQPIANEVRHEDRVFPFRALLLGGEIIFVPEKLIHYRVEGGISRNKAESGTVFLKRYTLAKNSRTIVDAKQRLTDAEEVGSNHEILRLCRKSICEQEAFITLSKSEPLFYEIVLLSFLSKGCAKSIFWHYLKLRSGPLFDIYYRRRFSD